MRVEIVSEGKSPTQEEVAAITAAIESLFDRETPVPTRSTPVWRFSGRWWR